MDIDGSYLNYCIRSDVVRVDVVFCISVGWFLLLFVFFAKNQWLSPFAFRLSPFAVFNYQPDM